VKRAGWATVATAAALGAAACGSSGADAPVRVPDERLRTLLVHAPDSGLAVVLDGGDTLRISAQTVAFYRRNRYRPAWSEQTEATASARAVHASVAAAQHDGLDPNRYGHDVAERLLDALATKDRKELDEDTRSRYAAELDLVLSEGFMRYATDLVRGTIDPEEVGRSWRIPRPDAPTEAVLRSAVRGDPVQIADRLRPQSVQYRRLMSGLQRLREARDAGGWLPLPADIRVAEGDSTTAVIALRSRLASSEDPREAALARRGADRPAVYDRDLRDALRHFQRRHGIDDDGLVGSSTLRELNHTVDERIAEVRLNLDRWRWLPTQLGSLYVMVNIAGFELEVVENGRPIEAMNVVVGKPGWTTPVFADTMKYIVVNPYWTPPQSILQEEIYPAMARDPGYLARNNFERTRDGTIRQRPGRNNALGRYKFMFPNDDNIYLHDTPASHLFSRARRDFSHGCVRVERPADLARLLVTKTTQHSPAALDGMLATGAEKWITMRRPVPIYIVYFTTWAKEDGTLRFHHDVYGHDGELDGVREELNDAPVQRVAALSGG
jgi:L,D-transpeptidase YcbB